MTDTYNPIISEDTSRLRLFRSRPTPEPGVALVLFREGQSLVALLPGDRLTSGEVKWGNYKIIYKIDIAEHLFSFNSTLPCRSDAFEFHAQVNVTCSVDDPVIIVERNITDARAVLEPLIVDTMRNVTRRHNVEQSAEAEDAIVKAVREKSKEYDTGFTINRFVIKLSLEQDARAHIRQLKQIERTKERERRQAELERQRSELEIERMKMKMDFYSPLIKGGQWQLLALQLANHPEDIATVAQMISQQRQAEMEHQLRALKIMLEEDVLEGFQMEEASRRVLERFVESFGPELESKALGTEERKALPKENTSESAASETSKADIEEST